MGRRDGYDVNEFKTRTCYDVVLLRWPDQDNEGWCWTVGVQKNLFIMFYQYWYLYYRYVYVVECVTLFQC